MRALTGTGALARLILRRDRVLTPVWVLFVAALPPGFVAGTEQLYPTLADRLTYARTSGTTPRSWRCTGRCPEREWARSSPSGRGSFRWSWR
jgi:putative exporter of polyketide antibiotics